MTAPLSSEHPSVTPLPQRTYNGVFALVLINLVLYILDHPLNLPLESLYLNHSNPSWYQFITSLFCHANWTHLSSNIFMLYIFGRLIEEDEGVFGVISVYLLTGTVANGLSWILQPSSIVSLGASGAVFGLFVVSVLLKLSWDWRRMIEVIVLGQFVVSQVLGEIQQLGLQDGVNRIAHLGGAIAGGLLVIVLRKIVGNTDSSASNIQ
ncbi:MAG: rhomboid family intramembrane serine protease [Cyanobacteria bacterium P01_E01_bin.6]